MAATNPDSENDLDTGKPVEPERPSEYGLEQMMASEEALEEARKDSGYHFSQDQLDHKGDEIDTTTQHS